MDKIKKLLNKDQYAAFSGIELLEISPGKAKAKMPIKDMHRNGIGTVHGGAIFTLADFTFAAASNSHGTVSVALNTNISFVKAATKGTLYATAEETAKNNKVGTYTVKITDDANDLVAIFEGMSYRKKDVI